jgi:hypothetical protein
MGGVDVEIHIFLTSVLAGGEWSTARPGRFTPGERAPGSHWIGGWVEPRAGLDEVEKILDPTGDSNSDPSVVQLVASPYTDCTIPVPIFEKNSVRILAGTRTILTEVFVVFLSFSIIILEQHID